MSNTLLITVRLFVNLKTGKINYGYTAADNHAAYFEDFWTSLEYFFDDFPDSNTLQEYVLNREEFQNNGISSIVVEFPDRS